MRIGLNLGYFARQIRLPVQLVQEADRMGVYAVWMAEAYGNDAVTPLAWLGPLTERIRLGTAIMQMPARTPANAAMIAMTLNQLSGGRFLMGLGVSGPQVVEGWHGVGYRKPLTRTREYIDIVRTILARQEPLTYDGQIYQLPYLGPGSMGQGKPLKSMLAPQPDIPLYLAAIGPKNVTLAAEKADGWLPVFFAPERYGEIYAPHVNEGLSRAGREVSSFDVAPSVPVAIGDDLDACYDAVRPLLALYIGGMGSKEKNFYNDLAVRYGYADAAHEIQELYLSGKQLAAMGRIPKALIDEVALVGPPARIRERLARYADTPVQTLNLITDDVQVLRTMVELVGADT
jgi:F420-dependent oxidoreductase-like protein